MLIVNMFMKIRVYLLAVIVCLQYCYFGLTLFMKSIICCELHISNVPPQFFIEVSFNELK